MGKYSIGHVGAHLTLAQEKKYIHSYSYSCKRQTRKRQRRRRKKNRMEKSAYEKCRCEETKAVKKIVNRTLSLGKKRAVSVDWCKKLLRQLYANDQYHYQDTVLVLFNSPSAGFPTQSKAFSCIFFHFPVIEIIFFLLIFSFGFSLKKFRIRTRSFYIRIVCPMRMSQSGWRAWLCKCAWKNFDRASE